MELIAEISRLKRINSELIELLDHSVRKQVQLEHEQKKPFAAPLSQPKQGEKTPVRYQALVDAGGGYLPLKEKPGQSFANLSRQLV